jgi:hypothetical protein
MGRFAQLLGGGSFSTSPRTTLKPGTRFGSLNRDSVAAFDKELLASIMGVKPTTPTPISLPSSALKLNVSSPVAGQNWRVKPQALPPPITVPAPATMRQVGEANAEIFDQSGKPRLPGSTLKPFNPGTSRLPTPTEKRLYQTPVYDQTSLEGLKNAGLDALDLFEAQGRRGVNGLIYWMNDLLIKTNAPGTGSGQSEKNKQAAAFIMQLAGDKANVITSKHAGTWSESVVTAINGGLSLAQSVVMGLATQGGNIGGAILGSIKRGSLIATMQLGKTHGYAQAAKAVANAVTRAAGKVGLTPAASLLPATLQSAVEGGAIYKELTDMGKTSTQASLAALMSVAGTALSEAISLDHLYQGWIKNIRAPLAARLTTALGSATFETVQELGQNLWQNFSRASVDDTQQLFAIEETIDTIIGIFPASFLLGGASFSAAGFRQAYAQEARTIEAKIAATFQVDDATAQEMADQAIEQFGPVVRDVFLHGIDTKEVTLAQALEFERTSDPYIQWLVQKVEKPSPASKQTTADTTEFAVTPTTDRSLNRYLGQQASPTQRQQTVGRGRWSALYEEQVAAQRQPLKPMVGVRPEMQPIGSLVEPPIARPTGPITTPTVETRTPVAPAPTQITLCVQPLRSGVKNLRSSRRRLNQQKRNGQSSGRRSLLPRYRKRKQRLLSNRQERKRRRQRKQEKAKTLYSGTRRSPTLPLPNCSVRKMNTLRPLRKASRSRHYARRSPNCRVRSSTRRQQRRSARRSARLVPLKTLGTMFTAGLHRSTKRWQTVDMNRQ